ncbi:hypothetical protein B0H10DRAFT_1347260 [Mycena sp. CBHHK59/15]|nr:hypothetical protein B0H10DRAFT_1347260 [Mycena sp. CBHHK59/15]
MSPTGPLPPQQWSHGSWSHHSYGPPPPPPDTQYNTAPPPPLRPPSSEPQRGWSHPSYAPPPPPPPLDTQHQYSPPVRPRSDEPQRPYAPPPLPPLDSPNPRQSHSHGHAVSQSHSSYHPSQAHHPPHPSPPQSEYHRSRRRRDSTPAPPPEPEPLSYPAYSPSASSGIDFLKLVDSYRVIMEAGKALSAPREGAMDRMLENAFYGAQVLDGASAAAGEPQARHAHLRAQQHRPRSAVHGSPPVAGQQAPVVHQQQQQQQPQLQRIHSASTVSSGSDTGRPPIHFQSSARSPPRASAKAKERSPKDVKAKMRARSPVGSTGTRGAGDKDTAPAVMSSSSKPQSQKSEEPARASAGADTGHGSAQDGNHSGGTQKCLGCGATSTPEWRRGPLGPRTLCNACGLVYAKLVKKRMREDVRAASGSGRAADGRNNRAGQSLREESPEAESDEEDDEQYEHAQLRGR